MSKAQKSQERVKRCILGAWREERKKRRDMLVAGEERSYLLTFNHFGLVELQKVWNRTLDKDWT